jgi:hypothetical protein
LADAPAVYVESRMHCALDDLWRLTQDPVQHARWDLRFTSISYIGEGQPQRFSYRLGPIAGWGETAGEREREDGGYASALRFGSRSPFSLIEEGSGYWLYLPQPGGHGIRFLTRYDYKVRWGRAGLLVDRLIIRPLIGWATAWSFDRLRLWLEEGVPPERSLRAAFSLRTRSRAPSARRCLREPPA